MKLGQRLLVFYFLILGLVGWFVLDLVFGQAKPLVRQSAEETLVDAANLLAEIVASDAANGEIVITPALRSRERRQMTAAFARHHPEHLEAAVSP